MRDRERTGGGREKRDTEGERENEIERDEEKEGKRGRREGGGER